MKTKTTVLKSLAIAGALTAAGTVATTTAHADVTNSQVANVADDQIANLNSQIQQRQANDATARQSAQTQITNDAQAATDAENTNYANAVAKQKAANDNTLKSANEIIVTEQQKAQQTTQENMDFRNKTSKLDAEHNANISKINADSDSQTKAVNQKIIDAQNVAKADHATKLAKATKQVDGQIADAQKAVNNAQNVISNGQNTINTKSDANQKAQAAVNTAQKTLTSDQSVLDAAQKALKSGKNLQTTEKLNVPAEYINFWKEFNDKIGGFVLSKKDHPELWKRNHDACIKAEKMNDYFVPSAQDLATPVHYNSDLTLSREDVIIATQYAAEILNPIREAIGKNPLQITNASIDMTMENASKYRAKGHNDWDDGHDGALLNAIAKEWGTDEMGESLAGVTMDGHLISDKATVADLKYEVFQSIMELLFEGADDNSDNGHTTDLLGVHYNKFSVPKGIVGGSDFLGVTFDIDAKNGDGWMRFNTIGDGHGALAKLFHESGYDTKLGTSQDKSIQGSNYDHIAVPTPESKAEVITKLKNEITKFQSKVSADTQMLNVAKAKAQTTANDLRTAQAKLAQDQKSLTSAQVKLNNLKANRDKMIQDLVKDPSNSQIVKKLQNQLSQIKTKHDDAVKAENNSYQSKLDALKKNHEAKLDAIKAEPTSLAQLKAELQAKLDILKKDHEAKLAQIQSAAQDKIAALQNKFNTNDPEIAKLQAEINTIKANRAKQQELYNSQVVTLNAAKGVNSAHTVVLPSAKTAKSGVDAAMTHESQANGNGLPQTGNENGIVAMFLGAMAMMFGLSFAAKKRY